MYYLECDSYYSSDTLEDHDGQRIDSIQGPGPLGATINFAKKF